MLKRILDKVIGAAIKIGNKQLEKIKNPGLRKMAIFFVNAGRDVAGVFLDDDKDNEKQLKGVVRKNASVAISQAVELAEEKMLDFKDPVLRRALTTYMMGIEKVLKALVDDDPNNEAQIKQIFEDNKKDLLIVSTDLATDKLAELVGNKINDPNLIGVFEEIFGVIGEILEPKDTN